MNALNTATGKWIALNQVRQGACYLLVLVERMTRETLIFKLTSKTQKEVEKRLSRLERKMGRKRFAKKFSRFI